MLATQLTSDLVRGPVRVCIALAIALFVFPGQCYPYGLVVRRCFVLQLAIFCNFGDFGNLRPPPIPIPIWRGFERHHSKSSQIGVMFSGQMTRSPDLTCGPLPAPNAHKQGTYPPLVQSRKNIDLHDSTPGLTNPKSGFATLCLSKSSCCCSPLPKAKSQELTAGFLIFKDQSLLPALRRC